MIVWDGSQRKSYKSWNNGLIVREMPAGKKINMKA
jgi:hypothetical protein